MACCGLVEGWKGIAHSGDGDETRLWYCVPILLASAAIAVRADPRAQQPAVTYATSGTCVNLLEGFNSKLEPTSPGTTWTTTFNATGVCPWYGERQCYGSWPIRGYGVFWCRAAYAYARAGAYKATFTSKAELNPDGSYNIVTGTLSGAFTHGPYAGQTFSAAPGLLLEESPDQNGVSVQTTIFTAS